MSEPWPVSDDEAADLMDKMVRVQRGHSLASANPPQVSYVAGLGHSQPKTTGERP